MISRHLLACATVLVLAGCGDDVPTASGSESGSETTNACPIGSEGCPCTAGGFCDGTLVCMANLCVEPMGGSESDESVTVDDFDLKEAGGRDSPDIDDSLDLVAIAVRP